MVARPEAFRSLPYDVDLVGYHAEDGFPLDGLLYSPKAGATTAVVLIHGKTCNFLGGPSRFLPLPLARAGYASFAVNMRVHSLGYCRGDLPFENFDSFRFNMAGGAWEKLDDGHKDLAASVGYLRRLGYAKVALAGHSSGGFYAGDYAGRDPDLAALILFSPLTTNRFALGVWFKSQEELEAMRRQAEAMVAAGQGHLLLPLSTWYYAISAATFLDRLAERPGWWDEHVGRYPTPTLLLYGDRESRGAEWEQKFRDVIKSPKKELVAIKDSEHMYLGHEGGVAEKVVGFLNRYA
jgi:pimeloyl-ACP methyl ester carboxylesterase